MGWVQSLSHSPQPLQTLWPVAPSSPLTWVRQEAEERGAPRGSDRLPLRCDQQTSGNWKRLPGDFPVVSTAKEEARTRDSHKTKGWDPKEDVPHGSIIRASDTVNSIRTVGARGEHGLNGSGWRQLSGGLETP